MDLQEGLLNKNWNKNYKNLTQNLQIDPNFINVELDNRLCLTSIIRFSNELKENVLGLINILKKEFPEFLYYENEQLHITLTGLIPLSENFYLSEDLKNQIITCFSNILSKYNSFLIHFEGLNLAPTAVILQGKYKNKIMDNLRADLFTVFKKNNLNLDYNHINESNIGYAWSVIARFNNKEIIAFLNKIKKLRDINLGAVEVKEIELVITNKTFTNVKILKKFKLKD